MTRQTSHSLFDDLQYCNHCPLLGANFVPGEGSPACGVFVVGEAPGAKEEEERRPFIGKPGQLLRDILEAMGWVEGVYFTNVLPRRPMDACGQNRKPTAKECKTCGCHLDVDIAKGRPNYVITLGATPLEFFTGHKSIQEMHGLVDERHPKRNKYGHEFVVMPTFQPSYVLRNGGIHGSVGHEWLTDLEEFFGRIADGR
jgi:uracil-DNA glycosylase family 4